MWTPAAFSVNSTFVMKPYQSASPKARARQSFLIIFADFSVSRITAWLSSIIARESMFWKSVRAFATRSCTTATIKSALRRMALPRFFRVSAFCLRRRLQLAFLRCRGFHVIADQRDQAKGKLHVIARYVVDAGRILALPAHHRNRLKRSICLSHYR